jgi:membrane protein implicated in regulation of membrane protease activity
VRRRLFSFGPHTIVGELGTARRDDMVFVQGELWRAKPISNGPLRPGQRVRVAGVDPGLVLEVEPLPND